MPGFEYSVFMPENPKAGISATCYNGYMLKYFFTRGKSYVTVGAFKAVDVPSSDLLCQPGNRHRAVQEQLHAVRYKGELYTSFCKEPEYAGTAICSIA